MNETYRKLRPEDFDQVVGQDRAVQVLQGKLGGKCLPHVVLFAGPSGSGKTTLAGITARRLGCTPSNLVEQNCADVRGIDSVRAIESVMHYAPLSGASRVWILDEVVQLPKTTQQAFLTILENPPDHVWFLLCTSDMTGLLDTFKSRCFQIHLNPLADADIQMILERIVKQNRLVTSALALEEIASRAEGNARKALMILDAVMVSDDAREQARLLGAFSEETREKSVFLARLLLDGKPWSDIVAALADVEDRDLESLRRGVLAYASRVLCGNFRKLHPRAYLVLLAFEEPWTWTGRSGLVKSCYDCVPKGR